eukprot:SAG31_NODE_2919_length_4912_cov_52.769790_5_plen_139_part_00
MSRLDFVDNNRRSPDLENLSQEFLDEVYAEIQVEEIKIKDEVSIPNEGGDSGQVTAKTKKKKRRLSLDRGAATKGTPRRGSIDGFVPPMLGQERFEVDSQQFHYRCRGSESKLSSKLSPLHVGCPARNWHGPREVHPA